MSQESYLSAVEIIRNVCSSIDGYSFVFGAEGMPAVLADRRKLPCIYLEEYRSGWYNTGSYGKIIPFKNTVMEVSFIYVIDTENIVPEKLANARENAREVLEDTGVRVFIDKFNTESVRGNFKWSADWKYDIVKPMFDVENEVSIMLQVNLTQNYC